MPSRFKEIDDLEILQLQKNVSKKLGINPESKLHCDHLSEQIESETRRHISVNTLRRFFELMPSKSKPSFETLNILASYCGYEDFYDFKRSINQIEGGVSNLNIRAINEIYAELGDTKKFYDLLNWLLILGFREKNIPFLKDFFNLNVLRERKDYPRELLQSLVQTFGLEIRKNPFLFDLLIDQYSKQATAQSLYFEWFVDLDYLNVRFYKGMQSYTKNKTDNESRLFGYCLMFLHHFLLNERNQCEELIKKINSIQLKDGMHPFPIGRKFACNILYQAFYEGNVKSELINEVFRVEKSVYSKDGFVDRNLPSFHLMIAEAFNWSGIFQHAERITDLANDSYSDVIEKSINGSMIPLKMYRANSLFQLGKTKEAIDQMNQIDLLNFDLPWRNFYWMNYNLILSNFYKKKSPHLAFKHLNISKAIATQYKFPVFQRGNIQP